MLDIYQQLLRLRDEEVRTRSRLLLLSRVLFWLTVALLVASIALCSRVAP